MPATAAVTDGGEAPHKSVLEKSAATLAEVASMMISDWKPLRKNTLVGAFTVTLDSGLIIHKCTMHHKDGARWIGLPGEKFRKKDGTTGYAKLVEFTDRKIADRFRDQVLRAIDAAGVAR